MIEPTQSDIDTVLDKCSESQDIGESRYPGMTYEEGLRDAIEWMQGDADDHPLS